mmetsp:Transcript_67544/g.213827  ORF Transcript_67544/g.213827 Transcript_67544/m.213827 type:complete len:1266 (-) Transcript_67544:254-4051(-)
MAPRRSHVVVLVVLIASLQVAKCDVYLNNPRGSNNKLNEVSNNVQNDNRLFDSQNNGAGGYQVGDNCKPVCSNANNQYTRDAPGAGEGVMKYYEDSVLYVEWTHQHASGPDGENPNVHSDIVLQYMCDDANPALKDGKVTNTIPTTPEGAALDSTFGQHEPLQFYQDCQARERNKGLFTADRNVQDNKGATATRQNNNGQRHGFECAEERDYWPYWHPSPWTDLAVLTSDVTRCDYYKKESENVRGKFSCSNPEFNNQAECESFLAGGVWRQSPPKRRAAPSCEPVGHMRDNHHGNGADGVPLSYNWTIPRDILPEGRDEATCVLRIRYNISSGDYVPWGPGMADSRLNKERSPVLQNPTKDFLGLGFNKTGPLRLAINTQQVGRVFEDRTHAFKVLRRPRELRGAKIWNLNVRGRRGNIVQVYPSVEYDFAPQTLVADEGDYVHVQWTGSDANPSGNAGEGRRMTDRSNLVQMANGHIDANYPMLAEDHTLFLNSNGKPDEGAIAAMAFLNQGPVCDPAEENTNDLTNCALLNAAPAYFDGGVRRLRHVGHHYIASTRNNNFSNRSQKASIIVLPKSNLARIILGSLAGAVGLAMVSTGAAVAAANAAAAAPAGKLATALRKVPGLRMLAPMPRASMVDGSSAPRVSADGAADLEDPSTPLGNAPTPLARWWFAKTQAYRAAAMFGALCTCFFCLGFVLHSDAFRFPNGHFFALAKGGGYLLDLALTMLLFPMMKNLVSWVRTTPLGDVLPLDDHHRIHIILAYVIAFGTVLHVAGHYGTFLWRGDTVWKGAVGTREGATGHMILGLMSLMYVTSVARHGITIGKYKLGSFDTFWLTHQLWMLVFALLFLHSEAFYKWCFWPLAMFAGDKLIAKMRGRKEVVLSHVGQEAKGTDVMSIHMRVHTEGKQRFHFKAGQYLYINCPTLSQHEWHPFTITSAPEEDLVSVHMRCRGDWTQGLRDLLNPDQEKLVIFEEPPAARRSSAAAPSRRGVRDSAAELPVGGSPGRSRNSIAPAGVASVDEVELGVKSHAVCENVSPSAVPDVMARGVTVLPPAHRRMIEKGEARVAPTPVVLKVDGPYGSGSDRTGEYDTVILVGTGIGVTPFVSVMKSLKLRQARERYLKPSRVYFYWVCRDRKEFEWFSWLINDLEGLDGDHFEINTYMTGELNLSEMVAEHAAKAAAGPAAPRARGAAGPAPGAKAQDLWAGNKWAGRPNWKRVFDEKAKQHAGESIGVFLCGPGAADLDANCRRASKGGTTFVFHKEVF